MTRSKMPVLAYREDLKPEELVEHFNYNPLNGEFRRVKRYDSWGKVLPDNKLITATNNRGYKWVKFHGQMFLVHRLAWLYMTGRHPHGEIDHLNGDRLDNRWANLRHVDSFENARNQGNRKDNTSGCRGVTFRDGMWIARISHKGVRLALGSFPTFDEAVRVRKAAERDLKYHINHGERESWRK